MQSEGNPPTWIQDTNSTGDCSGGGGEALWSNLSPHLAVSWTGYIVLPLAITPNDPSSLRVASRELLVMPTITAGATGSGSGISSTPRATAWWTAPGPCRPP